MRIGKMLSGAEYRIGKQNFANFWNFDSFPNWKNSENSVIFHVKFWNIFNFPIWKIKQKLILPFEILLIIFDVQIISKKWKKLIRK